MGLLLFYFILRYGDQAGRVSDDSLTTAGHVVDLAAVSSQYYIYIYIHVIIDTRLINGFIILY